MKRKILLAFASVALFAATLSADVFVRVGPPRPIRERRIPAPGAGYVWTPGYHRWEAEHYVWTPGAWVSPPRARAAWVKPRWVRRHGGWVMVEGHWR